MEYYQVDLHGGLFIMRYDKMNLYESPGSKPALCAMWRCEKVNIFGVNIKDHLHKEICDGCDRK